MNLRVAIRRDAQRTAQYPINPGAGFSTSTPPQSTITASIFIVVVNSSIHLTETIAFALRQIKSPRPSIA